MAHILILHGNDQEAIDETLRKLVNEQKASGMADLNLSVLDGKTISAEDFSNAVMAVPFISPQRFVILHNPLSMAGGREKNAQFTKMLTGIPETTVLYLVIPDSIERKDWAVLGKDSFLRKWAQKPENSAQILTKQLPSPSAMREWVIKKGVEMGGKFEPSAASALAAAVGNDTSLAASEIEKLLLYVDYARPVETSDVEELVSGVVSVSVFDMVDSLVSGNAKEALRTLHHLMSDQEIPQLFAMIVRQFRLLVQVREILDEGGNSALVQRDLNQVAFVADKLCRQASAFTSASLRRIYRKLLDLDYAFKTSQTEPEAALDLFILDIAAEVKKKGG